MTWKWNKVLSQHRADADQAPFTKGPGGMSMRQYGLYLVLAVYLVLATGVAMTNMDMDEFNFIREPYELIGGDYTVGYLKAGEYGQALRTMAKSYAFYWKYRPLFSPIIADRDMAAFQAEEQRFSYVKPDSPSATEAGAADNYQRRLIVPEPDRFYKHGAGKPLLPALLSIPQLALLKVFGVEGKMLLAYQFEHNYHPVFILVRLAQILAGLASILILYAILARYHGREKALLGSAVFAFFPTCLLYFPNIHHDPIMVPFAILAAYFFVEGKFGRAGLFFGLALASKNTAIFLVPAAGLYVLVEVARRWRQGDGAGAGRALRRGLVGGVVCLAVGGAVLSLFADPVAYAEEILTPLTHRAYDPRGENVESFSVGAQLREQPCGSLEGTARSRPEVNLVSRLLHFQNAFFFLVPGFLFLCQRKLGGLSLFSFLLLCLVFAYGLVFGTELLYYRYLLFIPFFVLLVTDVATPRPLGWLLALLLVYDAVILVDPLSVNALHYDRDHLTLVGYLFGR
jgi:hypothetical protein